MAAISSATELAAGEEPGSPPTVFVGSPSCMEAFIYPDNRIPWIGPLPSFRQRGSTSKYVQSVLRNRYRTLPKILIGNFHDI